MYLPNGWLYDVFIISSTEKLLSCCHIIVSVGDKQFILSLNRLLEVIINMSNITSQFYQCGYRSCFVNFISLYYGMLNMLPCDLTVYSSHMLLSVHFMQMVTYWLVCRIGLNTICMFRSWARRLQKTLN